MHYGCILPCRIGGIQDYSLTEGLHFRLPWLQYPIIYDIRSSSCPERAACSVSCP